MAALAMTAASGADPGSTPPVYPAPYVDAIADPAAPPAPLRLQGIDLLQNGEHIEGAVAALDSMQTVRLIGHWLPNQQLLGTLPLTLKFWSHDGKITRSVNLQVGPKPPASPWEPDRPYQQEYEFSLRPVADAFSGDSYLTLNLPSAQSPAPLKPLQVIPIRIAPRIAGRNVDTARYGELFGAAYHSLEKSFRLGNQADLTLPITSAAEPIRGIGLVSAFSYGSLPQGTPVCEIILRDESGQEVRLLAESGVATSKYDYDYHAPGAMQHNKVAIAASVEADYLSADGAPFMKHKYAHVLLLEAPMTGLKSITFKAVSDVVYDVYDIVLVY
jgi:hypothetical protein